MDDFAGVAPLRAGARLTVAIPARDEAALIVRALEALARQRRCDGDALPQTAFDVIVYANQCRDDTAAAVRGFAARHPQLVTHVVEGDLPAGAAHVGTARRRVMDAASRRFANACLPRGIVASTDADTIVDPYWIAATLDEARTADAVAGRIMLEPRDRASLAPHTRRSYLRDMAYRRLVGELEAVRDPVAHDPLPRHGQHYGASFAVTAEAYRRAGGVPALPTLEDLAFFRALERVDARVRHSMRVRVATSARSTARVAGGFATFLGDLHGRVTDATPFLVEHPAVTLARIDGRAALRRMYGGAAAAGEVAAVAAHYGVTRYRLRRLFDRADYFGANVERMEAFAAGLWQRYALVPIELALADLRGAFAASKVAVPTRAMAASGAG